ncbi:MAG: NusG domain II-containing protein [Clostridiales bacterium]|jgi:hypothetical protein|nr:NusG domain II-containing protein [Clostridiales bacterium]
MSKIKFTLGDKLIFAILVAGSLFWIIVINPIIFADTEPQVVQLIQGGEVKAEYSLETLMREEQIRVESEAGYNVIKISEEGVSVISASCPDQLCMTTRITHANQSIVCLPNKLIIKIKGKAEVDEIVY